LAIHPHHPSVDSVLEKIENFLARQGGRMTSVRREIAAQLVELKEPKTAYQILGAVNKKRKTKLSAISIYRTLDFLIEAGVVLKLESKNAFELCLGGKSEHSHLIWSATNAETFRKSRTTPFRKLWSKRQKSTGTSSNITSLNCMASVVVADLRRPQRPCAANPRA
jgi:Fur family zinc uptake transcriptional regulator